MSQRQPLDAQALGLMLFFCLCVGLQQVTLKATAADIAPVLQLGLRSGISAVLVLLYLRWRGERLSLASGNWRPGLVVGMLFALEYLLMGEALRYTSAAHAVVFLYTSPIFAALTLHFLVANERMAPLQWLGIGMAFAGLALAFMGPPGSGETTQAGGSSQWGDLLALLAGAAWGMTTVIIRTTRLAQASAHETLLYQLAVAFVVLVGAAALLDQLAFNPTPQALASLAFQGVMVSFIAFLIWFWLIRHYPASQIGVLSFMTPLFGVVLGAWLLDETIEAGFLQGALLVVGGIVLVSGHGWLSHKLLARRRTGSAGP